MTKFSKFINNLGTARDATIEGIAGLGFVRSKDLPTILGKFVRADEVQSFSSPEKAQARSNIGAVIGVDVQAFSTKLEAFTSAASTNDTISYSTGPNSFAVTPFPLFGRDLVGASDAGEAVALLGVEPQLIPPGGLGDQLLVKASNGDFDVEWRTVDVTSAVSFAPQTLTAAQKLQARTNIDSASLGANTFTGKQTATEFDGAHIGDGSQITGLVDFAIIYPNGGSPSSPANVTINSRYVMDNPFPGFYVSCEVQILISSKWGCPKFVLSSQSAGVDANQLLPDDDIIIQTGTGGVVSNDSNQSGNPFGRSSGTALTTAPCRVLVRRIKGAL